MQEIKQRVDRNFFLFLTLSNNEFLFKSELQEIMAQMFARMDRMMNNPPSHIDYTIIIKV